MKKLLLALYLLPAIALGGGLKLEVISYGSLEIHVFGEKKVQIYNNGKHMFGIDCSERIVCETFVTHSMKSEHGLTDGVVVPINKDILPLSAGNVRHVIETHKEDLIFILSTAGASGRNSKTQKFLIEDDGSFYRTLIMYDWMQYGHPKDYPL